MPNPDFIVLISADAEWREMLITFHPDNKYSSPYGEWFSYSYRAYPGLEQPILFLHGGWGKVAAAGSTQYVISRWHPKLLVNLGTCGGFEGEIQKGDVILVEKTVIYDIFELMGDPEEHLKHYVTNIDNSWLIEPLPLQVLRTILVSADKDLFCEEIPSLRLKYHAVAADWESGAIAWVAAKNHTQCLILRGVSDLVGVDNGEAYKGKLQLFYEGTALIMQKLLESLPHWLLKFNDTHIGISLK